MPTPFYHLAVAENLLVHPELSPRAAALLQEQRGAFLFGNTAPDVQVLSGQPRPATHFFDLPIRPGDPPAWETMLSAYPALAHPGRCPAAQAAFLAGCLCHLLADWLWVLEIFAPVFGPDQGWKSFHQRLYLHNVLRAYLDQEILPGLDGATGSGLKSAAPKGWLPFVQDAHLEGWRDFLAGQLQPGSAARTVEVFAARQGIPPVEYYRLLYSEERLDREIFSYLPRPSLQAYRERLLQKSLELLGNYLG